MMLFEVTNICIWFYLYKHYVTMLKQGATLLDIIIIM